VKRPANISWSGRTPVYMLTIIAAGQQPTCCSVHFNGVHEETCFAEEVCVCLDLKFYTWMT